MPLQELVLDPDYGPVSTQATPCRRLARVKVEVLHHVASDQGAGATHARVTVHGHASVCALGDVQEALHNVERGCGAIVEEQVIELETVLPESRTETGILAVVGTWANSHSVSSNYIWASYSGLVRRTIVVILF